jgi:hypothetical protein
VAVSKRLRFEILRRDNHACRYCGAIAPDVRLTIDHVVPVALGGSDEPVNLVTACAGCNSGKTSVSPDSPVVEDVRQDALRWAVAMERAAMEDQERLALARRHQAWFLDQWNGWTYKVWDKAAKGMVEKTLPLPDDWRQTVDRLTQAGLWPDQLEDALKIAMASHASDVWRYFCGVCWNKVKELQARALDLVSSPASSSESTGTGWPGV